MPSSILSSITNKKLLLLTHAGADVDAIGSCGAIYFALRKKASITIGVPEHINLNAKALAENLGIPYQINPKGIADFDFIIILDLNSFSMMGQLQDDVRSFRKPVALIDHHARTADKISRPELTVIREDALSTTSILYGLFRESGIRLGPETASCIAAGIVVDSAGFQNAEPATFAIMADALKAAGISYAELLSLFRVRVDISEKIALLKAAKRCTIHAAFGRIIVTTDVGAYEAGAASALVKLGADIAFAGDEDGGEIIVSGRADNSFVRETGFDLARDVFSQLEREFNGSGGGHAAAAAFNGKGKDISRVLERCLQLSYAFMREKFRDKKPGLRKY